MLTVYDDDDDDDECKWKMLGRSTSVINDSMQHLFYTLRKSPRLQCISLCGMVLL